MEHRVEFPTSIDSCRTTIGSNTRFPDSELGECLCRRRNAYRKNLKYLPESWTGEEISSFISELRRVFDRAAADKGGYHPVLFTCVGSTSGRRIILLDVLHGSVIAEKEENAVLKSVASRLPDDEPFEIRPWLLSGKTDPDYPNQINRIEELLRSTFVG